jgi:hypothetical protein
MTSAARSAANRENAKRSTGPRSRSGKARVAKNALRHGLAIPVSAVPELAPEVARLTALIAEGVASPDHLARARLIAEAEVDILRIRRARTALLRPALSDPRYMTRKQDARLLKIAVRVLRRFGNTPRAAAVFDLVRRPLNREPSEPERVAAILTDLGQQLARLDRYERRALSRRNSAVRAFMTGAV